MSRPAAAAVSVGCGAAAAALYLAVMLGSPGGLILVYLTQLALLAASDAIAAALFAGLNVVPVVILVRQALLARRQDDGTLQWYPPGLLAAWLTGMAMAGINAALAQGLLARFKVNWRPSPELAALDLPLWLSAAFALAAAMTAL